MIRNLGKGRKIDRVETTDDRIVYGGLPHDDFVHVQSLLESFRCSDAVAILPRLLLL